MPDGTIMPGATHGESMGEPQQQVDPAMQQITEFISTSINNGEDPVELVISLVDKEVDQETIANVFIQVGYGQEDIISLFKQVEERMQPPAASSPEQQTQNPQEISRNQAMAEEAEMQEQQAMIEGQDAMSEQLQAKSGIEINPKNKGKFTRWAKARGMSVKEAYNKVMSNTDAYPPSVVKMANFAKNAAGWKKQDGGGTDYTEGVRQREGSYNPPNRKYTLDPRFKKEGGEFKPHFMYKGDRKIRAKDMATHLRLKERGYNHDAPKAKGGKEMIKRADGSYSQRGMWDNIRANKGSGKKPTAEMLAQGRKIKSAQSGLEVDKKGNSFIDGVLQSRDEFALSPNYVNPIAFESGNNFSVGDAIQTLGTGFNKLLGSNDENDDGFKDGAFRDLKSKNAVADLNKGNYYNYEIQKDPNDTTVYGYDNLDLYNASIGEGNLRDLQTFTDDVNENSRVNFNSETGKYDSLISSRKLDDNLFGNRNAFSGENLNYFNDVDADTRQQIIDYGNASANGMPAGTTLSIDPETGAVSYVDAEVDNPNNYDTMMGYNTYGKGNLNKKSDLTNESSNENILDRTGKFFDKTGQFFEDKYNEVLPILKEGIDDAGEFTEDKYKQLLDFLKTLKSQEDTTLPEAQFGIENFNFTPTFNQDQLVDQGDYFSSMLSGQTNYMEDTQAVADSKLQKENPGLGATPLEQSNQAMFQPQQNLDVSSFTQDPTVKRKGKFMGTVARVMDSPAMKAYGKASEFAVQGARVLNNFFDDRAIEDAQADNRNNMVADNLYATKENSMLKRGAFDINTGTFGSEGQRTVRRNMGIAQKGGETATVDSLLLAKLIAAGADIEIL